MPLIDKYLPSTLGFDHIFNALDRAADITNSSNTLFPPVNVSRSEDGTYEIEVAVAGYSRDEVSAEIENNYLTIVGEKKKGDENKHYIVKGIAGRSFKRTFVVADTLVIREAKLNNGILTIVLDNVIPESKKPRRLEIL